MLGNSLLDRYLLEDIMSKIVNNYTIEGTYQHITSLEDLS